MIYFILDSKASLKTAFLHAQDRISGYCEYRDVGVKANLAALSQLYNSQVCQLQTMTASSCISRSPGPMDFSCPPRPGHVSSTVKSVNQHSTSLSWKQQPACLQPGPGDDHQNCIALFICLKDVTLVLTFIDNIWHLHPFSTVQSPSSAHPGPLKETAKQFTLTLSGRLCSEKGYSISD
ncbi:unnamed protein product [Protopolystoma xenopodis]|uniref:Uncharacterized protein n=1 Tax=Protopolystoma xenopodis TaxID=117903 RepID=A0A448XK77_9PLAT|nr:unnamed protein product [Protopolystoma xenopodis]